VLCESLFIIIQVLHGKGKVNEPVQDTTHRQPSWQPATSIRPSTYSGSCVTTSDCTFDSNCLYTSLGTLATMARHWFSSFSCLKETPEPSAIGIDSQPSWLPVVKIRQCAGLTIQVQRQPMQLIIKMAEQLPQLVRQALTHQSACLHVSRKASANSMLRNCGFKGRFKAFERASSSPVCYFGQDKV
jgi:hypothetical protein